MKIIDVVVVNDELDMLESRIKYLYDVVDHFIVIESNYTHSGVPKKLNVKENVDRFSKYFPKIQIKTFSVNSNFDFTDSWKLEVAQRNSVLIFTDEYSDDDMMIISDVDEIPNKNIFDSIKQNVRDRDVVKLSQTMFYYNLKNRLVSYPIWGASYVAKKKIIKTHSANKIRLNYELPVHSMSDGGWHLTYFMSAEQIQNKIKSFAHSEFNTPYYTNLERIQKCIDTSTDIYEREDHKFEEVDPLSFFPLNFLEHFSKWKK